MFRGVTWNLFLAVIPVVLGALAAWGMKRRGKQTNLPVWVTLPLLVVWLAFLPNTCYLLTEWRHLLYDSRWSQLLDAGQENSGAMLSVARWSLFFLLYSAAGVLTFGLAVRPVDRALRATGFRSVLLAPFLFFLVALGVYLGLRARFNSWDFVTDPLPIWERTRDAFRSRPVLGAIAAFGGVLWLIYLAVDVWIDGLLARLRQLGVGGGSGA